MELPDHYSINGEGMNLHELRELAARLVADPDTAAWLRKIHSFISFFLDPAAGPVVQETSGTTGSPRSHSLTRERMLNSAGRTIDYFELSPGDRVLACLPVEYIAGKMMIVRALLGELDLCLAEPSSSPLLGVEGNFSFAAMVPLQLARSLDEGQDLARIRKLLVGGGEIHPALQKQISGLSATQVCESFAMTETISHFALRRINGDEAGRYFRVMEGVDVSLDERGCLLVKVPGVTEGRVPTNDLVELSEDGKGFRWLGRIDNVINSGGIKMIPELLEERIAGLLDLPCLLLPEPDPGFGQRLVLMVETSDTVRESELRSQLKGALAAHEVPRRIVAVDAIPRNASYKPDRAKARELI